ncbi:MAG: hypothetical protein ABSG59_09125 [Verrucomicrobiota bacterium]|jgi:type II secretion system protein I
MKLGLQKGVGGTAFTLIEVMLAITIFCMAMFAILGAMGGMLHAAAVLRSNGPTAGMVAAQLSATNQLEEGSETGGFEDVPIYEGYKWVYDCREVATNGLYQVDFVVVDPGGNQCSTLSALFYRPETAQGQHLGLQPQR